MTFRPAQIVLVDTNVVLEAHRTGCWSTLAQYFALHTVGKVVEETQTGYQNRKPEEWIDEGALRASFAHIAHVDDEARAEFNMRHGHPALDAGERDLLIYGGALGAPAWWLNSPDMAAVRFAHAIGWTDRLVSLEAMVSHLRARLREDLRGNYTERWLSVKKTDLLLNR